MLWRHKDESVTRAALASMCLRSFEIYSIGMTIKKWNTLTRLPPPLLALDGAACDELSLSSTFSMGGFDCALLEPSKALKSSVLNDAVPSLSWRRIAALRRAPVFL